MKLYIHFFLWDFCAALDGLRFQYCRSVVGFRFGEASRRTRPRTSRSAPLMVDGYTCHASLLFTSPTCAAPTGIQDGELVSTTAATRCIHTVLLRYATRITISILTHIRLVLKVYIYTGLLRINYRPF